MSLSSFLLGGTPVASSSKKGKAKASTQVDEGLDAVFRSVETAPSTHLSLEDASVKFPKRKRSAADDPGVDAISSSVSSKPKRSRTIPKAAKDVSTSSSAQGKSKSSNEVGRPAPEKGEQSPVHADGEDELATDEPVTSTVPKRLAKRSKPSVPGSASRSKNTFDDDEDDEEGDPSTLVHETISKKVAGARKAKYVPADETPKLRDRRTIFVGNVPLEVVKSRPLQKQLKRHLLSFVPSAKIESVRFRSVAFQAPTAKLPDGESEATAKPARPSTSEASSEKPGRAHERERAASWRGAREDPAEAVDAKKRLTPAQKKKVAFIRGDLHGEAQAVHAYIVFAHPVPRASGAADEVNSGDEDDEEEPAATAQMDPYEAAQAAVAAADGSVFMERTLRVDRVGARGDADADADAGDPKRTVFVGNLDFASKEEDLRVFFEGVVAAERGPPPAPVTEEEASLARKSAWVARVRIVRDRDTQLGKGFAYVQFADRECVDEILNMEEQKLKFAKRKLRVQRCRTVPGGAPVPRAPARPAARPSAPGSAAPKPARASATRIVVPKGDPSLGARLASLSKDERKLAKAADAERIARRAAKKKARMALGKDVSRGGDRERVRKRPVVGKNSAGASKGKEAGRRKRVVDLAKRNLKK